MKNHKKRFLILSFALILLSSCYDYNDPYSQIEKSLSNFDSGLVSHFPRNRTKYVFQSSSLTVIADTNSKDRFGVWARVRYRISERIDIDSLINMYSSSAIKECYHNDSCNLLLPRKALFYNTIGESEVLPCSNSEAIIPVPLFEAELQDLNLEDLKYLPESYTLYVLGAKPGKYVHENLLMEEGYMPEGWEHGYTKGVAINKEKREAIYWIEIW